MEWRCHLACATRDSGHVPPPLYLETLQRDTRLASCMASFPRPRQGSIMGWLASTVMSMQLTGGETGQNFLDDKSQLLQNVLSWGILVTASFKFQDAAETTPDAVQSAGYTITHGDREF